MMKAFQILYESHMSQVTVLADKVASGGITNDNSFSGALMCCVVNSKCGVASAHLTGAYHWDQYPVLPPYTQGYREVTPTQDHT